MLSRLNMTFPETGNSVAFNEAAASMGWPMFCDGDCNFNDPMLSELLSLWRKEAVEGIPSRSEFTARKLRQFLRNIAIYERIGEGAKRQYRIRLIGSGIVQRYGELSGKLFEEAIPQQYLDRWYAVADISLLAEKPIRVVLRADTFDQSHYVAEYLCAPLKASCGRNKLVLIGMVFNGRQSWSAVEAEERQRRKFICVGS